MYKVRPFRSHFFYFRFSEKEIACVICLSFFEIDDALWVLYDFLVGWLNFLFFDEKISFWKTFCVCLFRNSLIYNVGCLKIGKLSTC